MDRLLSLLQEFNFPYAYHHFAEGESPEPPFLIYLIPKNHHFSADGKIYHKTMLVRLELYSDKKDIENESTMENVLERNDIYYQKSSLWIESESLYETIYEIEMEEE